MDKKMKILYVLLFMHGGMAQIWAANKTNALLANRSMFNTLEELLAAMEDYGDHDLKGMAHTQLHMLNMTVDEYMANFKMWPGDWLQ